MFYQINHYNDLTANNKKFEATYQNGKYGFTVDGTFYEIGEGGNKMLDYSNKVELSASSTTNSPFDGEFIIDRSNAGSGLSITINGCIVQKSNVIARAHDENSTNGFLPMYLPVRQGDIIVMPAGATGRIVPYT